jgi:hypothetical protein
MAAQHPQHHPSRNSGTHESGPGCRLQHLHLGACCLGQLSLVVVLLLLLMAVVGPVAAVVVG